MTTNSCSLLVVEGEELRKRICGMFEQYETLPAFDYASRMGLVSRCLPPVVVMDLGLPPEASSVSEGFRLLEQILVLAPDTEAAAATHGRSSRGET